MDITRRSILFSLVAIPIVAALPKEKIDVLTIKHIQEAARLAHKYKIKPTNGYYYVYITEEQARYIYEHWR